MLGEGGALGRDGTAILGVAGRGGAAMCGIGRGAMAGRCGGGAGRNAGAAGRAIAGGGAGRAMAGGGAGRAMAGGGAGRAMGGTAGRAAGAWGAALLCSWAYAPALAKIAETPRRNVAKQPPSGSMIADPWELVDRPSILTIERRNRFDFVVAALRRRRTGEHTAAISSGLCTSPSRVDGPGKRSSPLVRHVMLTQPS